MLPGVGIFGTGVLARATVHFLKESGFKIVAVWSRTLAEAKKFATELAIPFSTNRADDLLLKSEVGFVVIACTPHLQSPIAVKALGIGKHVIASWPAGTSQLEVLKMVKAATYYPSLLSMMCHGIRFLPSYIMMKEKVEEGLIGEVYLFEIRVHSQAGFSEYDWRCDGMMGGGALSIHGSYIIDTVSYLSGKNIKSVNGMVKTYVKTTQTVNGVREITGDDFCSFQMILDGGVTVSCTINNLCEGESLHEVIVVGSKGRLIAKDLDLYVRLSDHVGKESCLHEGCKDDTNNALSDSASQRAPFFKGLKQAFKSVAEAFKSVEDVHGWQASSIPDRATFDNALTVQTVIDSVRKASQLKAWVDVKVLDEEPDPNPHLSSVVRRSAYSAF